MDRLEKIEAVVVGSQQRSPTKNMEMLLSVLGTSEIVPEADKYYTFVYKAKTPGIKYDQHPLVYVISVFNWGFVGFNAHWNDSRQYSWQEVLSNLYEIKEDEIGLVERIPTMYVRST